jgi:hypothetical protein
MRRRIEDALLFMFHALNTGLVPVVVVARLDSFGLVPDAWDHRRGLRVYEEV